MQRGSSSELALAMALLTRLEGDSEQSRYAVERIRARLMELVRSSSEGDPVTEVFEVRFLDGTVHEDAPGRERRRDRRGHGEDRQNRNH